MTEIVLVRHGQASFGADDYDRLSPLGHQQAEWLGDYFQAHELSFDRAVRGGLRRHRETLEGLSRSMPLPEGEVDPRFDEMHYFPLEQDYIRNTGSTAAASREEFLTHFPRILISWEKGEIGGGGESYADFEERVLAGLGAAKAPGGTSLIVTSGGVIGVILRHVMGLTPEATADLMIAIHNASVHRLIEEEGRLRLSLFNASPHLDPRDRSHARTYV